MSHFRPESQGELEDSPAAALFLHWIFATLLIAATSSRRPMDAYTILVQLYAYTLVLMVGLFVTAGLVYVRTRASRRAEWMSTLGFAPWGGPTAAIIYGCVFPFPLCHLHHHRLANPNTVPRTICAFLIATLFAPPSAASPFSQQNRGIPHYAIPAAGLGSLLIGYAYYLVFAIAIPKWRKQVLEVEREPILVRQGGKEDGQWVLFGEVVQFWWAAREPWGKV